MSWLTPQKRKFVDEYVARRDVTEAAIAAGYSKRTAARQGSRLLSQPVVAKLVAEMDAAILQGKLAGLAAAAQKNAFLSADEVLAEMSRLAKNAKRDSDRITALVAMGKFHALWEERQEVTLLSPEEAAKRASALLEEAKKLAGEDE